MAAPVLALEDLSIDEGRSRVVDRVSFSIPPGRVFALLGRPGSGKSRIVQCALGLEKPSAGRAILFGEDAAKHGRKLRKRTALAASPRDAERALDLPVELLVLDGSADGIGEPARGELFERIRRKVSRDQTAVFLAAADPGGLEAVADRVAILARTRLAADAAPESLFRRFRRISYRNEITETRTEYGAELDAFDAVRVRVRGWGVEAVVSNFDGPAFDAFARPDGVADAKAEPLSLPEIFEAVAGETGPRESRR